MLDRNFQGMPHGSYPMQQGHLAARMVLKVDGLVGALTDNSLASAPPCAFHTFYFGWGLANWQRSTKLT